ncbi:Clp protease N-terminal domain-containing protein [Saccharothrix xinjiangensis]|uniref:Clp protease N-terminal domain-containing protein n=1 Tax=Saccharothrix xinjiangensis TaxID=204798 RepID=A0ABV9Y264_9PSEU
MERFTEGARQVSALALREARGLKHTSIGTGHQLLGLLGEGGAAAAVLASFDLSLPGCREHVRTIEGRGGLVVAGHLPFTPGAKRALAAAVREAFALGQRRVGTEHLLLGLLTEEDGLALDVLTRCGVDAAEVRDRAFAVLAGIELPPAWRPARLFLSHRPQDLHVAGRIADRLGDIGRPVVGDVAQCDVLLAVIAPGWTPTEAVLGHVETARTRSVPVIPVLVDGAELPHDQLPGAEGVSVRHETFREDVARLADAIRYARPGAG